MQTRVIRRTVPVTAVFIGAVVVAALVAVALAVTLPRTRTPAQAAPAASGRGTSTGPSDDFVWGFLLREPVAAVLGHRAGLEPMDLIRTHAFGWDGPTIHEVTSRARYLRVLRREPTLSPLDLVRATPRGA